ncbi:MAG: YIP1 family protein [Thermomicrobiales bacterium]|nr:YIP1 family protein [Thermomicrobiales bacterium]MCA9879882.1 YIP1 family protein [Thermomicrobiales bacterium]
MSSEWQESFGDRLIGVVRLNRPIYEAIKRDPRATTQALLIVVFLGLATGIALTTTSFAIDTTGMDAETAAFVNELTQAFTFQTNGQKVMALASSVITSLIGWYITSWLLTLVGNRMSRQPGDRTTSEQMRRLVGWGYAPQLASFLAPIPVVGPLLAFVGGIWAFVTGVMAVRTAFNVSIGRAIAIEILAFLVYLFAIFVVVFLAALLVVAIT